MADIDWLPTLLEPPLGRSRILRILKCQHRAESNE
jgi:hypothetical protein